MGKVIVAKTAGFCFGVKRAVEQVYRQIEEGQKPIYTFGPIIHNEEVVKDFEARGVQVIDTMEEIAGLSAGTMIIRSHGATRAVYDVIREQGLNLIDATCPFVKKIHKIVERESKAGKAIIIIGNDKHPEVEGIKGWSESDTFVIGTEEEAEKFTLNEPKQVCIVSQTTFNYKKFQYLVEIISKKSYDINVVNTICNATHERQVEAQQIAKQVEQMIVIGGKNSSNTQKLFEICKKECEETYYIQTLVDLQEEHVSCIGRIGITAGASTPNNIIEEVQLYVRTEL